MKRRFDHSGLLKPSFKISEYTGTLWQTQLQSPN
jgi:hypothetical protein